MQKSNMIVLGDTTYNPKLNKMMHTIENSLDFFIICFFPGLFNQLLTLIHQQKCFKQKEEWYENIS